VPLLSDRRLTDRHRLICYRRRGYAGSSRTVGPVSIAEQAGDCRGLLSHLDVRRAHVVGHSLGGAVALQLAVHAPQLVGTLSLLDPAVAACGATGARGARVAIDEFLQMRWPAYREPLERLLPGALEQAVADAPTCFGADLPGVLGWRFGEAEAARITAPVLLVLGERSAALHPRFAETHRLLLEWLSDAEGLVLPDGRTSCSASVRGRRPRRSPASSRATRRPPGRERRSPPRRSQPICQ
jgi:pimeloyl-ACP methyl ester carboxylesterase